MRLHTVAAVAAVLYAVAAAAAAAAADGGVTVAQLVEEGQKLMARGEASGAIEQFNLAISRDPRNAQALYRRAVAFLTLGRSHQAENDLSKVILLDPSSDQAFLRRGTIRLKQGNWDDAAADLAEFQKRNPRDADVGSKLAELQRARELAEHGTMAVTTRRYADGLASLSEAIELAPQSAKLRLLRGEAHQALGDIEAAIADMKRAALLTGDDPSLFLRIATLHVNLGELDAASEQLKQCLRSDPEYKPCLQLRRTLKTVLTGLEQGAELVQAGKWPLAVKHYEGLVQGALAAAKNLPHQRQQALHQLCAAYIKTAAGPKALQVCTEAIELNNGDWESYVNRAEAHILAESYDDAVRDFQKANEINRNNRVIVEGLQRAEKLARNAKRVDYYKVLGVSRTASKADIKRAYRKLAQEWHPDKYRGDDVAKAQAKMAQINSAHEVLADDALRAQYDAGDDPNDPARNQQPGGGNPFGGGFPGGFNFFGGGGGGGGFQFHF